MLLSYLKIAWKVLLRRKFFTAISLFGISFTLMILLVVYAMYDFTVGPQMPEKRVDRLLYANTMYIWGPNTENQSGPSYSFLEHYIRPLRTPEKVSISTGAGGTTVAYVGNQKLKLDQKYTDAEFWQILDFDFVEGRPYSAGEVRDAAHVAVINETTARRYFGSARGVLGRVLVTDEIRYQVVGVVRDVPATRLTYADVWMPITTSTQDIHNAEYMGSCMAIILARTPADLPAVQQEFAQAVARAPLPTGVYKWCKEVRVYAGSLLATHVRGFYGEDGPDPGVARFGRLVAGLGLLFMLLPALSLININISRIRERSSEIGVRKAFGATSGALVRQFLVENIFLTLLGGVLGLGLAAGALHLLNTSGLIAYTEFGLNGRVFAGAVGAVLLFGILSGVYPAYKMSKLQAIKALKGESTPA